MKGLILKDFYMIKKYCKSFLFIAVLFLGLYFFASDSLFILFYPCLICGTLPVTLLGYDEQSGWLLYSGTLPYKKEWIVTSKYIIGLAAGGIMYLATGAVLVIQMVASRAFNFEQFAFVMTVLLLITIIVPALGLPFMFRFGTEKGRLIYYIMVGICCAIGAVASFNMGTIDANAGVILAAAAAVVLIYILSYRLSISWYKKREL